MFLCKRLRNVFDIQRTSNKKVCTGKSKKLLKSSVKTKDNGTLSGYQETDCFVWTSVY